MLISEKNELNFSNICKIVRNLIKKMMDIDVEKLFDSFTKDKEKLIYSDLSDDILSELTRK